MYFYRGFCWDIDIKGYGKGDVLVRVLKINYNQIARVYHGLVRKGYARCRFGIKERFDPNVLYLDDGVFLMPPRIHGRYDHNEEGAPMIQNTAKSAGHTMPVCVMVTAWPAGMPDRNIG